MATPFSGRTLLVRLPNPLGDVVMATPLLRALRRQLPETRLMVAGRALYRALLEGLDSVDAFVDADGADAPAAAPAGSLRARAAALRAVDADAALLLPNSWSSALAAWRAGIPRRIGRRHHGRGALLTDRLPPIPAPASMDALYLEFLAPLGLRPERPPVELRVTRDGVLERHGAPPAGARLIGVAPGAAFGPSKRYPNALLAEALTRIHDELGLVPLLLGAPQEHALLADLDARLRIPRVSTHARPGDLGDAKALIARCAVLLAADNGARHVAAALGVPQVVWFGPTHPAWSGHAEADSVMLRREELDCLACHSPRCPRAGHPCMRRIAPADVVAAVADALAGRTGARGAAPGQRPGNETTGAAACGSG